MKFFWKQFVAWDIGLKHNVFQKIRIKLTLFYLSIIFVIIIAFSFALFYSFAQNIQDNFEGNYQTNYAQTKAVTKSINQFRTEIIFIDIGIILFSAGLSYFLAGRTLRPIQKAMEKQKQFTADASHELRTPLSVIRTNLEVALREGDQFKKRELITDAVDEIKFMTKLTEDLLFLSKMENNKKIYEFEKIDLINLAKKIVEKISNIALNKNISLTIKGDSAFINGNVVLLQRLMENVIANSIFFTPENGSINVVVYKNTKKVYFSVGDTGIGITKKDLSRIFERFYRADKSRSESGTGLGLSIVSDIAREHNGEINIESEEGKGTIIKIIFPEV